MAAGLGYIEFTTGDILTAANANGYLASQTVMVFANAAARTSAIASPQEGMMSYLKDTDAVEKYNGSSWVSVASASTLGLTLITTQSFSAAGTVSVNDCFSTTYDHYKIILSLNASAGIALNSRFRVSGADNTTSNYRTQRLTASGATVSGALSATTTSFEVTDLSTEPTIIDCDIYNPFASKKKNVIFTSAYSIPPEYWVRSDTFNDTTSFTGISFITTSGTVSGTLSVWGYSK